MLLMILLALSGRITDARYPVPSPDGSTLAFTWRGMLFVAPGPGGDPRCLTPGRGFVTNPSWSPEGDWIAFTSTITGGGDVYVMPGNGGEATRLTFHSGEDLVAGWEGESVLFTSSREGGDRWVYSVPVTGGTPVLRMPVPVRNLARASEGFVIETGSTPWWRRRYYGSASSSLWVGDGHAWAPLAHGMRDQRWPFLIDGEVYFVMEDDNGLDRFWIVRGDSTEAVSRAFPGGITFPGAGGGRVAFESGGSVLSAAPPDWSPDTIVILPSIDLPFPMETVETAGTYTDCFSISREGGRIAMESMGMIFAGSVSEGEVEDHVRQLGGSPHLMRNPRWSPDGSMLLFQMEDGRGVTLMLARGDPATGYTLGSLDTGTLVSREGEWAPDGERISFLDQEGALHTHDLATGLSRRVGNTEGIIHHSWSPDGAWLAFSVPWQAHREDVFIVSSRGGTPVNVSRHPNDDFQPLWPRCGRRLIWASRTDDGDYSIRQAWLRDSDWRTDEKKREEILDGADGEVEIDFTDFVRRVETLCTVRGWYDFYHICPDGRTVYFPAHDPDRRMDLWSVNWDGGGLTRLTRGGLSPSRIQVVESGEVFFLSHGNTIRSVPGGGGAVEVYGWSCPYTQSVRALQAAKFDHAWRLLRDNFYDPAMHGTDWNRLMETYRDRALAAVVDQDFNDVVRRMLGELSASHLGIWGPWRYQSTSHTGELGIIPGGFPESGGVTVDSVIPGSPGAMKDSRLFPGDVILSVNGVPVGAGRNLYSPLRSTAGREIGLEVLRRGRRVQIKIEPTSAWNMWRLIYREWVAANRRTVESLSMDRVGYLHVPAMNQESVENFRRDLYAEGMDREAMIIDIRGNGGGNTHDQLLASLGRPSYAESRERSGRSTLEPLGVWNGPLVLVIDENCYSDAEIFAAAWKELNLGPVVGNTTYGAVIGTVNVSLADGTSFRLPGTGWYTLSGVNLENTGVAPDVYQAAAPSDPFLRTDRQLAVSVETAMALIGEAAPPETSR